MTVRDLVPLEEVFGWHFERPELLQQALTHSSHAKESRASQAKEQAVSTPAGLAADNEQLEFLGDAILGLVVSEQLFQRFPHFHEGELSKLRAHLVSELHLVNVAERLHLGDYLLLGRGEERSGGRAKKAILVDALEAVIAALYLDAGLEAARKFVMEQILAPELQRLDVPAAGLPVTDSKSALQELLQASGRAQASYTLVKEDGPDHRKTFTVEVRLPGSKRTPEFVGRGQAATKKKAEQDAARQVLDYLTSHPQE